MRPIWNSSHWSRRGDTPRAPAIEAFGLAPDATRDTATWENLDKMCGFLAHRGGGRNDRIRFRGPDLTTTVQRDGFTFVHNLLSITGAFAPQPFVDGGVVCLYNGEVYNQPFKASDGDALIPLYRRYGPSFARHLDGEFAIALYDFEAEIAVFATDPFKSKPLFLSGIECASYRSGVGGEPARPNETLVKRFDGSLVDSIATRDWSLEQFKSSYDDWLAAFERAIAKRATPGCFIGLSSGYDSGAIACALLHLGVPFKAFIFRGSEDAVVLAQRARLVDYEFFEPDPTACSHILQYVDNEPYTILWEGQRVDRRLFDDGATFGVGTMAQLARAEGRKVALSGQGADEILSDYSPWPGQSSLLGRFPDELELWPNFNFSCQESYLMKEEYACGAFGVENRYPFLDADLVQEFLWLLPSLKNSHYKAPVREYLLRHAFPFEEGAKRGFFIDPSVYQLSSPLAGNRE